MNSTVDFISTPLTSLFNGTNATNATNDDSREIFSFDEETFTVWYVICNAILLFIVAWLKWDFELTVMKNIKGIWSARSVYGAVLIQLFDQATDLAVLVIWWQKAELETKYEEEDVEHLDMWILVWSSIVTIVSSRVTIAILVKINYNGSYFDSLLALLELYIIKEVYNSIRNINNPKNKIERTAGMKIAQLVEANLEAIPQVVLQCVYILRQFASEEEGDDNNIGFFVFSVFWSVIGASKKYMRVDKEDGATFVPEISKWKVKGKPPFINTGCLLRHIWRLIDVMCRLCLFVLLWAVCGGYFLGIFFFVTFVMYCFAVRIKYHDFEATMEHSTKEMVENFSENKNMAHSNNNNNNSKNSKSSKNNSSAKPENSGNSDGNNNNSNNNSTNNFWFVIKDWIGDVLLLIIFWVFTHLIGILWFFDDSIHSPRPYHHMIHRFFENVISYGVVIMFAFTKFDCDGGIDLCANPDIRYAPDNDYVLGFLIFGIVSCLMEPFIFSILYIKEWTVDPVGFEKQVSRDDNGNGNNDSSENDTHIKIKDDDSPNGHTNHSKSSNNSRSNSLNQPNLEKRLTKTNTLSDEINDPEEYKKNLSSDEKAAPPAIEHEENSS